MTSDEVDGFILDRGFQVILDSYPEARRALDFAAMRHRGFSPGALVRHRGKFRRVVDPWRAPIKGLASIMAPFVGFGDALRLASLRRQCINDPNSKDTRTAEEFLQSRGFSSGIMESFFRPFFRGVTLDPALGVPAWYFQSLFGWFSTGSAGLPERGMRAVPEQLASGLDTGSVRLGAEVVKIEGNKVQVSSGETHEGSAIVLATDFSSASALTNKTDTRKWLGTTTLYFAADKSPVGEPILVLDGDADSLGPINHLCVLSDAQPGYAPAGKALISATIVGIPDADDDTLEARVREQMLGWYGQQAAGWKLLRIDRIGQALPSFTLSGSSPHQSEGGLFACGDYLVSPSIQGALLSGRNAGEAVTTWLQGNQAQA